MTRRWPRRVAVTLGMLATLLGSGLVLAAGADAHASVVSSDPADGSRLKRAPSIVTITFDEPVGIGGIGYLHVTNASGKTVDAGNAFHPNGDARKVADKLRRGLGDSDYTASFRIISADSHPVAGTIRFVVGHGPLVHGDLSTSAAVDPATNDLDDLAHGISYVGLALLGGIWLLITVWPAGRTDRRARMVVGSGLAITAVGVVAELLLQGPYGAGSAPGDVTDGALLTDTLNTGFGRDLCVRLALLVLLIPVLAALLRGRTQVQRAAGIGAAALIVAVIATFTTVGHASTTSPVWLSMTADGLHLLAMSVWLGGLAILLRGVLPRNDPAELRTLLPVFSTVAFGCVTTLAVTGGYAAWRGVGTVHAVFATTYGLLVVAKIVLFVGLLAVANLSRRHVQQRLLHPDHEPETNREALRRSVVVELAIAGVVLAVTAVLVAEPRGKEALLASYRQPASATTSLGGRAAVGVTVEPDLHGPVDITVDVAGRPGASVALTATQQKAEVGPLPITLHREGVVDGDTRFEGTTALPVAGTWDFDLVVSTSRFDATTADVSITLH